MTADFSSKTTEGRKTWNIFSNIESKVNHKFYIWWNSPEQRGNKDILRLKKYIYIFSIRVIVKECLKKRFFQQKGNDKRRNLGAPGKMKEWLKQQKYTYEQ